MWRGKDNKLETSESSRFDYEPVSAWSPTFPSNLSLGHEKITCLSRKSEATRDPPCESYAPLIRVEDSLDSSHTHRFLFCCTTPWSESCMPFRLGFAYGMTRLVADGGLALTLRIACDSSRGFSCATAFGSEGRVSLDRRTEGGRIVE